MQMLAAFIKEGYGQLSFIPNPKDEGEIKQILGCSNLGKMDIETVNYPSTLYYDADEPDLDNGLIPLVVYKWRWRKAVDKSKVLVCNIPESHKIGFKNRYTGCHLLID